VPRIILTSLFVFCYLIVFSQDDRSSEKNILYTHATDFGILVHTRGFGADVQLMKQRTVNDHQLFDLSILELKHPKEISQPNPDVNGSNSYVFGKINNLIVLNLNYGTRYVIADRNTPNDVKVNLNYSIGPVIGWLKPVYYQVRVPLPDGSGYQVIDARFDPNNTVYQQNTIGVTPDLFKGISQSFVMYGGCAKLGLNFEWGRADYKYYSLETGVMVNAFPTPVPIFATIKNDQVFVNLYASISYGIRK